MGIESEHIDAGTWISIAIIALLVSELSFLLAVSWSRRHRDPPAAEPRRNPEYLAAAARFVLDTNPPWLDLPGVCVAMPDVDSEAALLAAESRVTADLFSGRIDRDSYHESMHELALRAQVRPG